MLSISMGVVSMPPVSDGRHDLQGFIGTSGGGHPDESRKGISARPPGDPWTRKVYGAEVRYKIVSKLSWMTLLNAPTGSSLATTQGVLP